MKRNRPPVAAETRFWLALLYLSCFLGFVFLLIPIAAVIPISFSAGTSLSYPLPGVSLRWYEEVFRPQPWMAKLWNSVIVAVFTTVLSTVLGTLAAYGLAFATFRLKSVVIGLLLAPMLVPLVISALAFFFAFAKMDILGSFAGMVIAHTVLATPFVLVTVMATLQGFDRNLVRAALSLGARPFPTFMTVTLPLILPGVFAGAVFAFMTSFDEIVVALFVSSPKTKTLPIELYAGLREHLSPAIIAIAALLILFSVALLGMVQLLLARARHAQKRVT